jgi:hypothetical protein
MDMVVGLAGFAAIVDGHIRPTTLTTRTGVPTRLEVDQ